MKKIILLLMLLVLAPFAAQAESAGERVLRTGVIRCGYVVTAPYLFKDINTGAMSGLSYDYMNALAAELDLKVEWTEEVGWGSFIEGLNTDRYDMMCVGVWQSGARARRVLLSRPIYYSGMFAYARADDHRFDSSIEAANSPDVTVAVIDGDPSADFQKLRLPKSRALDLTQNNGIGEYLLSVGTRKADLAFSDPAQVDRYNQGASVRLRVVAGGQPVRSFASVYAVKAGEFAFKAMIDSAVEAINTSGEIPALMKPYAPTFSPVAPGYTTATAR